MDNAWIVRGTAESIESLRAALAVIDSAPIESLELTLQRADPEAVRKAALALRGAGSVSAPEGKKLRFTGSADWLMAIKAEVFRAELAAPRPTP
jgi:hypothetical protein